MCLENMNFQEPSMNDLADEQEESSWTCYFEEFLWQNDEEMIMSCDDETLNSRVPHVASSLAINKIRNDHDQDKKLRFKKRKTIGVMVDDSLEDTASSPVCSPKKVAYFDQVKIKNKGKNTKFMDISDQEKVGFCEGNKRKVNPNMELKKRGLCLVPLSSLANYFS
ncbi:unnamed protein product [Lactuca saligna]|uniref:Uncharacterized protein n=1 Tax=Lactuca saligna TaxID=75948 RepID=A0AA35Z0S3_LACSI|nr:unnamed protein product [Lactuca saligna]